MTTVAYLRVSTDQQDVDNQRHGILEYANQKGLTNIQFVEDTVSGKVMWKQRKLGEVVASLEEGDTLIFSEFSRMSRRAAEIWELFELLTDKGINVHIVKQGLVLDKTLPSKIVAMVFGMAAEIERELISARTKEAIERRKAKGEQVGRPMGSKQVVLPLDKHHKVIFEYIRKGLKVAAIAKLLDVSRQNIYYWFDQRGVPRKLPNSLWSDAERTVFLAKLLDAEQAIKARLKVSDD